MNIERLHELFTYDPKTGELRWRVPRGKVRAGDLAGARDPRGYITVGFDGVQRRAHTLAWAMVTGEAPPKGMDIDHINRDKGDNRWVNLRLATRSQNLHNAGRTKSNSSGARGVYLDRGRGKFGAQISVSGVTMHLGRYDTMAQAEAALEAARLRHGVAS